MVTYNVKLRFEKGEDKLRLLQTLEAERMAFNLASNLHFDKTSPFGSKLNSIKELHNKFYHPFRDANPTVPAQVVIRAINDVLSAYRSVKSNKQKITAPPQKKALSMRLDYNLFKLNPTTQTIKLTAIGGTRIAATLIFYPKVKELFDKHTFCSPLLFVRDNEIFLSVTFNNPVPPVILNKAIGIDLGIKRIAALSDGRILKAKRFNAKKRRLRHFKSRLKSKGTRSAKRHLKKLRRKERRSNNAFIHSVVNEILKTDASTLVIEDLKKLKRNVAFKNKKKGKFGKAQNNKISQVPFFQLRQILEYKAQALGKRVVTVSPYMTSQEDSRGIENGTRKGCRYLAFDKKVLDADLNAANNIVLKYVSPKNSAQHNNSCILPVTCSGLTTKVISLTPYGQVAVTQPIVKSCENKTRFALAN